MTENTHPSNHNGGPELEPEKKVFDAINDGAHLPKGPFGCILADPPWSFKTFSNDNVAPARGEQPYSVMSLGDIKELPVIDVAAKDCLLFMWTVSHLQPAAFEVAESWGFNHVSIAFIWDKGRMGMGYWTRQEMEICHLFKRGKPKRLSKGVRSGIREPRREHSRKPDTQYERIEALCSGPRLELFARQQQPGWESWGNEIGKFIANDNHAIPVDDGNRITVDDDIEDRPLVEWLQQ